MEGFSWPSSEHYPCTLSPHSSPAPSVFTPHLYPLSSLLTCTLCLHSSPGPSVFTPHLHPLSSLLTWTLCLHSSPGPSVFTPHLYPLSSLLTCTLCLHSSPVAVLAGGIQVRPQDLCPCHLLQPTQNIRLQRWPGVCFKGSH